MEYYLCLSGRPIRAGGKEELCWPTPRARVANHFCSLWVASVQSSLRGRVSSSRLLTAGLTTLLVFIWRQVGIPLTQPTTTCRFGSWKTTRELSRSLRIAFRRKKGAERIWSGSVGRRVFAVRSATEPRLSWSVPPCSSAAVAGARPRPRRVRFSRTHGSRW
jgi:hypothetical protein